MGRLLDLLVLVLIESAVQRLIEPWAFISQDTNADGGAISVTDWSWAGSLPTSDYCLSIWLKTDAASSQNAIALLFMFNMKYFGLALKVSTMQLGLFSISEALRGGTYAYGAWSHAVIGTAQTKTFFVSTMKPGQPVLYSFTTTYPLESSSQLLVPYTFYDDIFVVSVM